MALRLTVVEPAWSHHVETVRRDFPDLLPVVKGNGYGFGRAALARRAAGLGYTEVAVGSVHELAGLPPGVRPVVLTPALGRELTAIPPGSTPVLTVGSPAHVRELSGWSGEVVVKLAGSMQRYGVESQGSRALVEACRAAGCSVRALAVHPPLPAAHPDGLAAGGHANAVEVLTLLAGAPADLPVEVSHLDARSWAWLRSELAGRPSRIRLGTALWHGDKASLHLGADVVQVRRVRGGEPAGYRSTPVPGDGTLVLATAGSAHGVSRLADGRSPFHWRRARVGLLEDPHMHTSMLWVPEGTPAPEEGDVVDVQRPLTATWPDEVVFVRSSN